MFSIRQAVPALFAVALATVPAAAQGPMEIVVNVPAGRLDVFENGARVRSYPVSVGTPRHATPTRQASIRRMVWNPSWTPPDAAWARDEKPAAPGWGNPMGRVKMHLFDDYYVHGTPARNERFLGRPASHGCIRMRNADVMELAQLVLRADGGAAVSDETVQRLVNNPRATRELALAGRVRVRVEYRLAEADAESVTLHPDVYARARGQYLTRVQQDLRTAGADATAAVEHLAVAGIPSAAVRLPRAPMPALLPAPSMSLSAVAFHAGLR
ncbi:MAG TPA: L,D-transpeptidase [Longimicrobium sp.]|jgi:murein L,D-transpeptidase YcbB/YkuD|uniref:L,D-transpeptidase n=1 Tax=Longimicrobium sp. TaxID=2029185 RepID=UPI002ED909A6